MRRRAARAALAGAMAALALSALGPVPSAGAQEPVARRVLVLSVPGLTWADVEAHDLPNLEALFARAALADLAPRGVSPRSGPGDAYLTISSGTRATTSSVCGLTTSSTSDEAGVAQPPSMKNASRS